MFKIVDVEAVVAQARAAGLSNVSVEVPLLRTYDEAETVTQTEWMNGVHQGKNYVWLHVDGKGEPFYAGWGRGVHAWQKNGGHAWEWFVRERLGGEYGVVVLAVGMSEAHAQSIFEQMLETYNILLLNQSSFFRGMDYDALKEENAKKDAIRPYYQIVRKKKDPQAVFHAACRAQQMQYDLNPRRTETGRFGEVLEAMNAFHSVNGSFITYVIEGLIGCGDFVAARDELEKFKSKAPQLATQKTILRLENIIARGGFVRTPKWLNLSAADTPMFEP